MELSSWLHSNKWGHVAIINSYVWVEHLQQPRQLVKIQTRTVHGTHGTSVTPPPPAVHWHHTAVVWGASYYGNSPYAHAVLGGVRGGGGLIDGCCWAQQKARCAKRRSDLGPFYLSGQSSGARSVLHKLGRDDITRCTRVGAERVDLSENYHSYSFIMFRLHIIQIQAIQPDFLIEAPQQRWCCYKWIRPPLLVPRVLPKEFH